MDIKRESHSKRTLRRRIVYAALAVGLCSLGFFGVSRLKPASPTVERSTVWIDTVRRGTMLRQVRGMGTLVAEGIWWIPAPTDARVQRILVQPGTQVSAETVLMELSNPELEQESVEAEWQLKAAIAELRYLKVRLQSERLDRQAALATIEADNTQAQLRAEADQTLNTRGVGTALDSKMTKARATELAERFTIEKERLGIQAESIQAQLAVQQSRIEQLRALAALKRGRVESLRVRAGIDGVLQQLPVQVGQHLIVGTTLAKVAQQGNLKAELKIAETQAKDIQIGQDVSIDTRNGVIAGHVTRIDPAVQGGTVMVDVALEGEMPKGARPDLSVDGTIELERLQNVLYIGRPTQGQADNTIGLFRLDRDNSGAARVPVRLGRSSVSTIEIVDGLREGDRVVLSDMSAWDGSERIQFK